MPSARIFSTIFVVLMALAPVAVPLSVRAQIASGNTYTIGGIDVDVSGADAVQARQQAIREARQKAVRLLVERMVPAEDRAKVPPVSDQRLDGMVRGVEFARERTAGNRYIGTLGVVFSAEPVKQWLGEAGISIAETVARAALVIALWKDKDGLQALDERNAWRDAWGGLDMSDPAAPVEEPRNPAGESTRKRPPRTNATLIPSGEIAAREAPSVPVMRRAVSSRRLRYQSAR